MLKSLAGIPCLLAQTWPAMLAWYLAGSLVRASIIALAAPIGPHSALAALLLVPIAVLARLISYIGMFLVLRRVLPGYRAAAEGDVEFRSLRETVTDFVRVLLATIGPFFALYGIIGLLGQDLSDYAQASFRYSFLTDNPNPLQVGDGPLVLIVVVVAFAARWLLTIFAHRLPGWVAVPQVYLEANWVFVALTGIGALFGGAQAWIANRQIMHWGSAARDFVVGLWDPIRLFVDGIGWITPVLVQVVLLPLAWILIASIIYLRSLANIVEDPLPVSKRISERVQSRIEQLPRVVREYRHIVTGARDEVWRPLAFSGRVILAAGAVNLITFVCTYGLLFAAGQWALRGIYTLVGAHEIAYWFIADAFFSLVVSAIVEPIRVAVLASAFDFALKRWRDRRMLHQEPLPELPMPGIPEAAER